MGTVCPHLTGLQVDMRPRRGHDMERGDEVEVPGMGKDKLPRGLPGGKMPPKRKSG